MRQRFWGFLLGVLLCLVCVCTAFAAETHSITVTAYKLEPGYYMCAVWDGDTLLTLFDAEVGSDGILSKNVNIGDTPISGNTVKVAISAANIDEDAEPIVQTNVPVKSSENSGGTPSKPDNSGGNSGDGSTGNDISGGNTVGSSSSSSGGGSSKPAAKPYTTPSAPTAPTTPMPSSVFSDVPAITLLPQRLRGLGTTAS